MDGILSGLNNAQRDAVISEASVLQVLAPPGSGKTKTLTTRVAHLISHKQLKPWNIIVCTFTVKAAKEMSHRIRQFIGDDRARQLKLGTFHSISLRYLKQYGHCIGLDKNFGIADTADSKAIVKRIVKQRDFTIEPSQARSRISAQKAKGIGSEEFSKSAKNVEQQEFAQVYQEYEATLKASNLLDYDDLLLRCCFLLRTHPDCVSNVEALLIDEFQDTNSIQYELMGLFAQRRNAITIVGDPDQSIYGFRSAEIKNLSRMKQQWPDTLTINLEENYRSSGAILHAAQNIIEQDESRPQKKLQATHSIGLRPVLRKLPSAAAEAAWLVAEMKRVQALTENMLEHGDFAVLLRSASLSRAIESALGKEGVPYRMIGGTRFYDRNEVKIIVDYLRVILYPDNSEAVERIINVPGRRIGEVTVKALHEEARTKGSSLWTLVLDAVQGRSKPATKLNQGNLQGLAAFVNVILSGQRKVSEATPESCSLVDLLILVLKKLSFQEFLTKKYPDDHEVRWMNVEELFAQATDASDPARVRSMVEDNALPAIEGVERRNGNSASDLLSLFLDNIALTASSEEKADKEGDKSQQLTISTIHAAKGLEWPVVFIPGCYDGSIPHSRADDNDEERRLLYVGMTRAQAILYLSCPSKSTQREDTSMSTFLQQSGVTSYFEEHGPSISTATVTGLATTLRRDIPSMATIEAIKSTLERDEDNYWPLTGEEPIGESTKWDYGRTADVLPGFGTAKAAAGFVSAATTMQQQIDFSTSSTTMLPGFVSVAARYEELVEQAQLKKVDKRAEQTNKNDGNDRPKGRKRQIEGQGTIDKLWAKRGRPSPEPTVAVTPIDSSLRQCVVRQPLKDIPNQQRAAPTPQPRPALPLHKLSTAPLRGRPGASAAPATTAPAPNSYVFLSSSPPQPDTEGTATSDTIATSDAAHEDEIDSGSSRPASTYHTTSMQKAAPPRKTLGMRRSLHGWNARSGMKR